MEGKYDAWDFQKKNYRPDSSDGRGNPILGKSSPKGREKDFPQKKS